MKDNQIAGHFGARLVISGVGFISVLVGGLFGIFAAMGLSAAIWGGGILDSALSGLHPDTSHPAHWVFPIVAVPAMLIGFAGTLSAIYFPVCFHWPVVVTSRRASLGRPILRCLLRYSTALTSYCTREISRLDSPLSGQT